jgi:hypothetical protein
VNDDAKQTIRAVMLTTTDNPHHPADDYDAWLSFDREKGYFTNEVLARITYTSPELSEKDNSLEIERAIDALIALHIGGFYQKVVFEEEV